MMILNQYTNIDIFLFCKSIKNPVTHGTALDIMQRKLCCVIIHCITKLMCDMSISYRVLFLSRGSLTSVWDTVEVISLLCRLLD